MTTRNIKSFITNHNPEKEGRLARVTMQNGLIWIGRLLPENQKDSLMMVNKWILIQGGSGKAIELNGNEIVSLKENR